MAKKCKQCGGEQIVKTAEGLKPCPALDVTIMGRLACKLPDGSFDSKKVTAETANARMQKDKAYEERNKVVSAFAEAIIQLGGRAGRRKTKIEGWNPEWDWCVYIDLPNGGPQISWHMHESHLHLFEWMNPYAGEWDGHDTTEKYRRLEEWRKKE